MDTDNQGIAGLYPKYIMEHYSVDVRSAGLGLTYNLGAIAGGLSPVWGAALKGTFGLGGVIAVA